MYSCGESIPIARIYFSRNSGGNRFGMELSIGNTSSHPVQTREPWIMSSEFSIWVWTSKLDLHNGHLMTSRNDFFTNLPQSIVYLI